MRTSTTVLLATAALATTVLAKTDLTGCTTTDMSSPAGASVAWYVPGTGELCDPLDCGGGRAPPKTDVPGCPQYTGTATYSPSYLAGYNAAAATDASSTSAAAAASTTSPAITSSASSSSSSISISGFPDISGLDTSESSWDLYTTNGALPPGLSSAASASFNCTGCIRDGSVVSTTMTALPTLSSSPYYPTMSGATNGTGNGTIANGTTTSAGGNGGGSSSTTSSVAGAATAGVCGLVMGLGALVAAL